MTITHVAILVCLIPAAAHAGQSAGLESVNQPVVSGASASTPNCPNWNPKAISSTAAAGPNFGCAVNSNMAAMMADPQDLIHGRTYTGTDIEVSTRAVRAWRDTPPTGRGAIDKVSAKGAN